jgi:hypothetical protein
VIKTGSQLLQQLGLRLEALRPSGNALALLIRFAVGGIGSEPILEFDTLLGGHIAGT